MLMVCHHLDPSVPEDLAFAESRIRPTHDRRRGPAARPRRDLDDRLGRPGDGPGRRGGAAHLADRARDEGPARVAGRRRGRTTTCGPAGTSPSTRSARRSRTASTAEVGSVEPGKLADLVLWEPAFFGVRPHVVLKGGMIAWAQMGDANASIPTPQPVLPRPMFGALRRSPRDLACTSSRRRRSRPGWPTGWPSPPAGAGRRRAPARQGRHAGEHRDCREIEVDPDTFTVPVDGEVWEPDPVPRAADGPALLPVLSEPLAALLTLADSRLPAGGHAHSGGVEQAVAAGLVTDAASLEAFLRRRLATAGRGRGRAGRRRLPRRPTPRGAGWRALDAERRADAVAGAAGGVPASRAAGWSGSAGRPGRTRPGRRCPAAPHHPVALGVAAHAGRAVDPRRGARPRPTWPAAGDGRPAAARRMDPLGMDRDRPRGSPADALGSPRRRRGWPTTVRACGPAAAAAHRPAARPARRAARRRKDRFFAS